MPLSFGFLQLPDGWEESSDQFGPDPGPIASSQTSQGPGPVFSRRVQYQRDLARQGVGVLTSKSVRYTLRFERREEGRV